MKCNGDLAAPHLFMGEALHEGVRIHPRLRAALWGRRVWEGVSREIIIGQPLRLPVWLSLTAAGEMALATLKGPNHLWSSFFIGHLVVLFWRFSQTMSHSLCLGASCQLWV